MSGRSMVRVKGEGVEYGEGKGRMGGLFFAAAGLLSTRITVPVHETMNSMR